jgi:hypothetical protein
MHRLLVSLLLAVAALLPLAASAQASDVAPKPETYLCPNTAGPGSIDCFLNAVEHLYTMCRQVKSIEIIEFGYDKSDEGVNGAKSEYCVDKHKSSISRPYQAALREAAPSRSAAERIRDLYEDWLASLRALKWKPGESDDEYKTRTSSPYESFKQRAVAVRLALAEAMANKSAIAPESRQNAARTSTKTAAKSPTNVAGKSSPKDAVKGATH